LILNPEKIIISTNRDENRRGIDAAEKIKKELFNHFAVNKVSIELPPENNDWNDELINNGKAFIQEWYKRLDKTKEKYIQKEQNDIYCSNKQEFFEDYYQ